MDNTLDYCLETGKVRFKHDTRIGVHTVPNTFWSDGASIPRIFWTLLGLHPKSKEVVRAAILHDYLISIVYNGLWRDNAFYSQLRKDGVTKWKAYVMKKGVVAWRWYRVNVCQSWVDS